MAKALLIIALLPAAIWSASRGPNGSGGAASSSPATSTSTSTTPAPLSRTVNNSTCPYGRTSAGPYQPNPPGTNGGSDAAMVIPEMPHEHASEGATVHYEHDPPTSGCHYSLGYGKAPIAYGAYPYTQVIRAEYWVHNLEHGYIAVLYRCPQGCDTDYHALQDWLQRQKPDAALAALATTNPGFTPYTKVIILPWPSMGPRFAAVSWDYYDPMETLDLAELQRFYDNHVGHAPEGVNSP